MAVGAPMNLHINYITMICVQFCPLNTIHHAASNNAAKYSLLHTTEKALEMLVSTLPCTISSMLSVTLYNTF